MDPSIMEALVDLKTKMLTATPEKLKEFATGLLPGLADGAGRAETVMAIETHLMDLTKEPQAADKLIKLLDGLDSKPVIPIIETTKKEKKTDILEHLRIKDFKIHGNIGEGKGCIGYLSFLRQIQSGSKHGHPERDLVDGVIKAIQAGSRLRGYLEGCDELPLPKLQGIIRAFYKERSATELYQELCSLKQGDRESTQEFVFRALELRQKLTFASKETTSINYDQELVGKSFRHSVSTGIRDDGIRTECHQLLQTFEDDEVLIEGVNDIIRRVEETKTKLSKTGRVSGIAEVEESAVLRELKCLRAEVNELKLSKRDSSTDQHQRLAQQTRRKQCSKCGPRDRCFHCWTCGSADHMQRRCPENFQGLAQRGGR